MISQPCNCYNLKFLCITELSYWNHYFVPCNLGTSRYNNIHNLGTARMSLSHLSCKCNSLSCEESSYIDYMPDTNQACIQKGSYFSLHILPILLTGSCSLLLKRWFRRSPVAALTGDTRPCFFLMEVEWLCLFLSSSKGLRAFSHLRMDSIGITTFHSFLPFYKAMHACSSQFLLVHPNF